MLSTCFHVWNDGIWSPAIATQINLFVANLSLVVSQPYSSLLWDELARIISCRWTSHMQQAVLELQKKDSRQTEDAEICTLRDLFSEIEEGGVCDFTVNSHDVTKPSALKASDGALSWTSD